jgi:uncharacterized protein (DUF1501 family)
MTSRNLDTALQTDEAQEHAHECAECTSAITRRSLLKGLLAGAATFMTAGGVSVQAAYAEPGYAGDTLVILSLRGGMDGLSAVAPLGDPYYSLARPRTAITEAKALKIASPDNMFGLHPSLAPILPLWQSGQFAAVHAVGTMDATRSHFAAMEQVENAAPGTSLRTGWLDRMMGTRPAASTFQATQVGGDRLPRMSQGPFQEMAISSLPKTRLAGADTPEKLSQWTQLTDGMHAETASPFAASVHTALAATMSAMSVPGVPTGTYPKTDIATALSDVAALIKSGLGLQVATIDQGNWDHHANMASRVASNLSDLAEAISAFAADLGPAWKNVTVVTMSEFGRRVKENGSAGTDHGHGNAMLVASGAGLTSGSVFGQWPTLANEKLSGGEDLAGTTDYRSVFAEVLRNRCGLTAEAISAAFPDFRPAPVGAFRPL